ncbi:uncharacterized protein LOC141898931 [Tubulanus polymorphus]|uniref:uncharacterized protein LOC141898931 n=1 Tax=Tubulanus polymorphus TaxID=672921 RepID=UPI003DA1F301
MLDGLAFLPVDDVPAGLAYLLENVPDEVIELLDYFNSTYVNGSWRPVSSPNGIVRLRKVPPMYEPSIWNVREATLTNDARTNNICESWNNKFYNIIGHHHPSIWRTIKGFQQDNASVEMMTAQNNLGNNPTKRVFQKYVQLQIRLRNLCVDYNNRVKNLGELLRGIGENMRFLG